MNQDDILAYVQTQLVQAQNRLRGYVQDPSGHPLPRRHIFKKLERVVDRFREGGGNQRWVIVPGLRGMGKTTVLAQLFLKLSTEHENLRMLYVSLDNVTEILDSDLNAILDAYERILGSRFEEQKSPFFIFVDEVQYDPKWGTVLKSLFDRTKKAFILCSGSSAVSLQTNADVQRRAIFEKLHPMSFPEYAMIKKQVYPTKGLKDELKKALYFSRTALEAFQGLKQLETKVSQYWAKVDRLEIPNYLSTGTLPFALDYANPSQVYEALSALLDKIIHKDIQTLHSFDTDTLHSIKRILFLLADADGTLSVNKLGGLLEGMSAITVRRIFTVLERAELLIRAAPCGSQRSKTTKPSKYFFMTPALRMSLLSMVGLETAFQTRLGRLLEDAAALHFYREFAGAGLGTLSYDPESGGADFVLQIANQRQLAIEIGIGKKDLSQVIQTMKKIKCDFGIVISENALQHFSGERVLRMPLPYFLLM